MRNVRTTGRKWRSVNFSTNRFINETFVRILHPQWAINLPDCPNDCYNLPFRAKVIFYWPPNVSNWLGLVKAWRSVIFFNSTTSSGNSKCHNGVAYSLLRLDWTLILSDLKHIFCVLLILLQYVHCFNKGWNLHLR